MVGTHQGNATHGTASDLELYTAEEVVALRNAKIFKSSNTSQSTPKLLSLASLGWALPPPVDSKLPIHSPKVEPDSSTKKRDYKSSQRATGALYPQPLEVMKT